MWRQRFHGARGQDSRDLTFGTITAGPHLCGAVWGSDPVLAALVLRSASGDQLNQRDAAVQVAAMDLIPSGRFRGFANGRAGCGVRVPVLRLRHYGVCVRRQEQTEQAGTPEQTDTLLHSLALFRNGDANALLSNVRIC